MWGRHSPDTKFIEVLFLDFPAYQTVNNEHLFVSRVPCLRYLATELSVDQYGKYGPFSLRPAKFWPRYGAVQLQTQHSGVWGGKIRTLRPAKAAQWNSVFRKVEGRKKRYLWSWFKVTIHVLCLHGVFSLFEMPFSLKWSFRVYFDFLPDPFFCTSHSLPYSNINIIPLFYRAIVYFKLCYD